MSETVPLLGSDGISLDHDLQKKNVSQKRGQARTAVSISIAVGDAIISILVLIIFLMFPSKNELTQFLQLQDIPTFAHFSLTLNVASILAVIDVCGPLILRLIGLGCFFTERTETAKDLMSFSFLYLVFRLYISMFDPVRFELSIFHKVYVLIWAVLSAVQATLFKDMAKYQEAIYRSSSNDTLPTSGSGASLLTLNRKGRTNSHDAETASNPSSSGIDTTDDEISVSTPLKNDKYQDSADLSVGSGQSTPRQGDDALIGLMKPKTRKPRIEGLGALRFFGVLHIIAIHFYSNSASTAPILAGGDAKIWYIFSGWGRGQLVLFFVLSGFVLAYSYSDRCQKLCTYTFWFRRFGKLFPPYLVSIVAMCILLPSSQINWRILTVLLTGTQAWVTFAFDNPINTTGWSVGVFLFLSMLFPPACRIISGTTSTSDLLLMLCWFWPLSALGATVQMGVQVGQALMPLYQMIFRAHIAEFLFGMTLGHLFLLSPIEKVLTTRFGYLGSKIGVTAAVVTLNVVYMTVDVNGYGAYFSFIGAYGLMIPVYAVMIWFSATNQDVVLSGVFSSRLFSYLGSITFQIYVFGTLACEIANTIGMPDLTVVIAIVIGAIMKAIEGDLALIFMTVVEFPFLLSPFQRFLSWVKSGNVYDKPVWLKVILYYVLLFGFIVGFACVNGMRLYGNQAYIALHGHSVAATTLNILRWTALVGGPATTLTIIGQILFCPWLRANVPEIADLLPIFKNRMYFRIVTRGLHPLLVRQNALDAMTVLAACLPPWAYTVEVVTDNRMDIAEYLQEQMLTEEICFAEVVVPTEFKCSSGAKYKARALHYAILYSQARESDWIVHLDEETRFDVDTVKHVMAHCVNNDILVSKNKRMFGDIGQGVILYGANPDIDNYITTLADSFRVGDDLGKFRLQYKSQRPWIGMHGSFVVCPNAVEKHIGFDHGMPGSITEDAFFALMAWSKGVKFSWVDGYMYEQSPFSIYDFVMQRRRWFGGLWLVCWDPAIPWPYRMTLLFMIITWAFGSLPMVVTASSWIVSVPFSPISTWFIAVMSAIYAWSYSLGFVRTFNIYDGIVRYFILFGMQILMLPIYAGMEVCGVMYAVINPPFDSFHIVKKEGKNVH